MRKVIYMKQLVSMLAIVVMIFVGNAIISKTTMELDTKNIQTVQVNAGDSLWTISKKVLADTEDIDIRDFIETVEDLNHLENRKILRPGETLKVPTLRERNMFGFITAWANN